MKGTITKDDVYCDSQFYYKVAGFGHARTLTIGKSCNPRDDGLVLLEYSPHTETFQDLHKSFKQLTVKEVQRLLQWIVLTDQCSYEWKIDRLKEELKVVKKRLRRARKLNRKYEEKQ